MSQKAVTDELALKGVYDVSSHNGGAVFESLSTLLGSANLSTLIPTSVRHGGMSIRFVQTSDNKYVQYRLMSDEWSTTEVNWQGVDDEPTAKSDNLVKSGGVYNFIKYLDYYKIDNWGAGAFVMPVDSDDNVSLSPNVNLNFKSLKIECEEGDVFKITTKSTYTYGYTYAFVNENGTILKPSNYPAVEYSNKEETAPFGVKYLLVTSLASFNERDVYMCKVSSLKNTIFELDKTKYYVGLTKVDFSDSILKKYYNFPSVGTTVDLSTILTDNSTFACIAVDCKGGDVFIASACATASGIGVFAILDEDNKVILV